MMKQISTILANTTLNIFRISPIVAPFTRLTPISLRRYSVSNITSPKTPISEMMIASRVKRVMRREKLASVWYCP